MTKRILGYVTVVAIFFVALVLSRSFGLWASVAGAAAAVVAGHLVGRIGVLGIAVTFLVLSVAFPVGVLYLIGADAGYEAPLQKLLEGNEWINFFYPVISALACYALLALIRRRKAVQQP